MAKEKKKNKKKARENAEMDFNFSDAFDSAERASRMTAVEVSEKIDPNTLIHSGSLVMDLVIFGGGLQAGRIYDLHGEESGGKTTLGNIALVQAIKSIPGPAGKTKGYYFDVEGTLDRNWFLSIARSYGIELSIKEIFGDKDDDGNWVHKPTIRLIKPIVGDDALKTIVRILNALPDKVFMKDVWMYSWTPVEAKVAKKTGGMTEKKLKAMLEERNIKWDKSLYTQTGSFMVPIPDNYGGPELVIMIDSMIALIPRQTAEDDSAALAQHGRMFSRWINAIKSLAASKGVTFININQLRKAPGVMFGDPRYAPGGEAIKYVADCRNILTPCANPAGGGQIEEDGKNKYRWTSMTNKKNKLFTPGAKIKFRWWTQRDGKTGCGLDPVQDTLDYLDMTGQIIEKGRKGFNIVLADHKKAKSIFDDLLLNMEDFKELILTKELKKGNSRIRCDMRKICLDQIKSEKAFSLYRRANKIATKAEEEAELEEES